VTLLLAGDRVVARATRSSDALAKATTVAVDVILFDLAIPDGLIGLAALRAATDIPIVLIANPADAELARGHGRCVRRDVSAPELAVAIELVCRAADDDPKADRESHRPLSRLASCR
jgi:DNA-binding response OmpR family regulator